MSAELSGPPRALAAKDKKGQKGKGGGVVNCPGWTDEYGNWNTGFPCPMWGSVEEEYCCGSTYNRFCCPEPEPIAPTETASPTNVALPLIAGTIAGVALILGCLLLCFVCPCCPARKWIKRNRKPNEKRDVEGSVCSHCQKPLSQEEHSCSCSKYGDSRHSLHHSGHGSMPRHLEAEPDLVQTTLYENHAVMQDGGSGHYPSLRSHHRSTAEVDWTQVPDYHGLCHQQSQREEPPPYDRGFMSGSRHEHDPTLSPAQRLSPCSEETPMIPRLKSPGSLYLRTFQPMRTPSVSEVMRHGDLLDHSRRDSGVLFDNDDQEPTNGRSATQLDSHEEEDDAYHEAIVVPKFKFQSLALVNKPGMSPGGLMHSKISGLSTSRGSGGGTGLQRNRGSLQYDDTIDSVEMEHLNHLMRSIQTEG